MLIIGIICGSIALIFFTLLLIGFCTLLIQEKESIFDLLIPSVFVFIILAAWYFSASMVLEMMK